MKGKKFIAIISIVCILAVILCVPAFATVTESSGDGYALYNVVKLPVLPEWDETVYPYAFINYGGFLNPNSLQFCVCKEITFDGSEVHYVDCLRTPLTAYSDDFVWGDFSSFGGSDIDLRWILWTNTDLVNSDGSVSLSASEPISLDGYNLIQWDGDPTGLVSVTTDLYILAPYEYAFDALAVWSGSTPSVQTSYFSDATVWGINALGLTEMPDGAPIVFSNNGVEYFGVTFDGIAAPSDAQYFPSLIAYRTVEDPPGEGGDTPDDPQPPFWAAEIYLKLHLLALTPQQK